MALSYTFAVNPGRANRFVFTTLNLEIKSIAATGLDVYVVDSRVNPPIETSILRNDIKLGTSIVIGPGTDLQFVNPSNQVKPAYFGAP